MDIAQAYIYAEASRDVYLKLPAENPLEGEEFMCGKLKKAMHVARDAAQNWQRKCSETVRTLGIRVGKVLRCHNFQEARQLCGLMHRDEFVFSGEQRY